MIGMDTRNTADKRYVAENGFSLIELIIAIAILVILTGLLAPQFMKYIEKSRAAVCLQNIDTVTEEAQVLLIENTQIMPNEALEEALKKLESKCPSGGTYSVKKLKAEPERYVVICGIHGTKNGEGVDLDKTVASAEHVLKEMENFLVPEGKTVDEWKKEITSREDWKKMFPNSTNNISNDRFREYLYKTVYNGKWPEFDSDILTKNGFPEGTTLYIQPYIDIYYKGFSETTDKNNITIFASTSQGNSWNATLFYNPKDNTWYKNSNNKATGFANQSWEETWDKIKDTWQPLKN